MCELVPIHSSFLFPPPSPHLTLSVCFAYIHYLLFLVFLVFLVFSPTQMIYNLNNLWVLDGNVILVTREYTDKKIGIEWNRITPPPKWFTNRSTVCVIKEYHFKHNIFLYDENWERIIKVYEKHLNKKKKIDIYFLKNYFFSYFTLCVCVCKVIAKLKIYNSATLHLYRCLCELFTHWIDSWIASTQTIIADENPR